MMKIEIINPLDLDICYKDVSKNTVCIDFYDDSGNHFSIELDRETFNEEVKRGLRPSNVRAR